jgi:hypothetical protein
VTQPKLNRIAAACLINILLVISVNSNSQELIEPAPAKLITKFEFTMLTGGIVIVHAQLDDFKDTLNFIFDTGSGGISLDSATVEYYQLKRVKTDKTIRGIAGIRTVEFTNDHTLHLPGMKTENLDFHVNDYYILSTVYGMKIDGIIGFSFLRRYIVALDYDKHQMSVYTPGTFKYPKGGYMLKPTFHSIPIQPAIVKDATTVASKFYFDTGAGLCLLLSEDFIKDSSVLTKNKRMITTQAEGLGGKKEMQLTVIKEVKLGPYRFRKVPTYLFKDDHNVTAYPFTGGLIGNDILRRFNVVLNYPDQLIHLKPNEHINDPFDYSYTGLAIYTDHGEIVVEEVVKDSPGERAGFKPGDRILAVNNNFSQNIQVYKLMLQSVGQVVKVLVTREGKPVLLFLKVRNILRKK